MRIRTANEIASYRGSGYSRQEYKQIREAWAAFKGSRLSFAYCEPDNTIIWREPGQRWQEDYGYAHFRAIADTVHGPEIGARVLGYFKRYCFNSHIDLDSKNRMLSDR